jgi:hypothetical protein
MATRRKVFQPEALESRALLASLPPGVDGAIVGGYAAAQVAPALGATDSMMGLAILNTVGEFRVVGFVDHGGANGRAAGEMVLTNRHGGAVLQLDGAPGSRLPGQLNFAVTSSSGLYQGLSGHGTLMFNGGLGTPAGSPRGQLTILIQSPAPPPAATGIQGTVMEGPIRPVSQIGVPNDAPLADAVIVAETAGTLSPVTEATSDSNGHFTLNLAPGTYVIVPLAQSGSTFGFPRPPQPQTVTVGTGQMTSVTFEYDTGIR